MRHLLPTAPTFSLAPAIEFLKTFPPTQGELELGPDSVRGAFAIGERGVPFTVTTARPGALAVETPDARVVPMVGGFLGVGYHTFFDAPAAARVARTEEPSRHHRSQSMCPY